MPLVGKLSDSKTFTPEGEREIKSDAQISLQTQQGFQAPEGSKSSGTGTKSEAELALEKLYEERIEEEYAKREGGA
jgi:hypothetical protein